MRTIYCFVDGNCFGDMAHCVALGDDGVAICSHACSSESWLPHDLGITSNWKHEHYDAQYGAGNWELVHVRREQVKTHAGLQAAIQLHKQLHPSEV